MMMFLLLFISTGDEYRLTHEVGKRQYRVYGRHFTLELGMPVARVDLPGRLERLGYQRVHRKPEEPGLFFWGKENFYIYQRAHRRAGKDRDPVMITLKLEKGAIVSILSNDEPSGAALEGELLSESLTERRAERIEVPFNALPELIWRPLLAAEDARFFSHVGLDGRALARSMLANIKAGKVKQGGSTLTQQLIKGRDLTPKRTLGRKASEAWRAVWLESRYDKEEILEAYLNHVYLGHVDGFAIHGYATAARVYFNRDLEKLTLAEATALAAMVQGPNRLSPIKHPERVKIRRDWILGRMVELGWLNATQANAAIAQKVVVRRGKIRAVGLNHFRGWLRTLVEKHEPGRYRKKKGVVLETQIDAPLQEIAEAAVAGELKRQRAAFGKRGKSLAAALVCLDARDGSVLAYVGGDPRASGTQFDHARQARRQPGSLVKPFILLEAFDKSREHPAYHGASLVADKKLRVDLPSGPWEPRNNDRRFHGNVSLAQALRHSYNVAFVRLGRHLGEARVARVMGKAGFDLPADLPPSFLLGSLETTPLAMTEAYTVFAEGQRRHAYPIARMEKPRGRKLKRFKPHSKRVTSPAIAWMVDDLLADSVANGSGKNARVKGWRVAGKTGTSSSGRDAWFVGRAGSIVTAVWLGFEEGERGGLSGGGQAAALFARFVQKAAPLRPDYQPPQPLNVTAALIDVNTGLRVKKSGKSTLETWVLRTDRPDRKRWWRKTKAVEIIE